MGRSSSIRETIGAPNVSHDDLTVGGRTDHARWEYRIHPQRPRQPVRGKRDSPCALALIVGLAQVREALYVRRGPFVRRLDWLTGVQPHRVGVRELPASPALVLAASSPTPDWLMAYVSRSIPTGEIRPSPSSTNRTSTTSAAAPTPAPADLRVEWTRLASTRCARGRPWRPEDRWTAVLALRWLGDGSGILGIQ